MTTLNNLDTYLNDHLAGATAALDLIEDGEEEYKGEPLGDFFENLKADIEADKATLSEVMQSLGVKESGVRQTGAWAAEKLARARLKIAGDESGLVLTLEGLIMGIFGKRMLWRSLAAATVPNISRWDFVQLQRRAEDQIQKAEGERTKVAQRAFGHATEQG
jgi:hypothetical protein